MQQALPYRTWLPAAGSSAGRPPPAEKDTISDINGDMINSSSHESVTISVEKMVSENAVIAFGRRGCCMCHVVKRLLLGHGVNPAVYEVDEQDEVAVIDELSRIIGVEEGKDGRPQFPAVFVGGKLFGGLERVMSTHISGELVPILKEAGALWL
uniref:Putative glutaredoxin-C9 n=1 Tax=Davidia involucrata TaxID=16924 RepID=A0A5B7AP10_DAVIN